MTLEDVKPAHVRFILEEAAAKGLKHSTVGEVRGVLHRIFDEAWRAELIESGSEARELNAYRVRTFKLGAFVDFFVSKKAHGALSQRRGFSRLFRTLDVPEVEVIERRKPSLSMNGESPRARERLDPGR